MNDQPVSHTSRHYLRDELYALIQQDSLVFEFFQEGALDGLWYWDLINPEHEWMSRRFWETLGYDPLDKQHLASEWQSIIFPEDLQLAKTNLARHLADPSYPYDQIVRYRHREGHVVWIRCRGIAIHNAEGTPQRLLGTHIDISSAMRAEEQNVSLRIENRQLRAKLQATERCLIHSEARSDVLEGELAQIRQNSGVSNDLTHEAFEAKCQEYMALCHIAGLPLNLIGIQVSNAQEIERTFGREELRNKLITLANLLTEFVPLPFSIDSPAQQIYAVGLGLDEPRIEQLKTTLQSQLDAHPWSLLQPLITLKVNSYPIQSPLPDIRSLLLLLSH